VLLLGSEFTPEGSVLLAFPLPVAYENSQNSSNQSDECGSRVL